MKLNALTILTTLSVLTAGSAAARENETALFFAGLPAFPNPSGLAATYSTKHRIDLSNPFFSKPWYQRAQLQHLPSAK